MIIIGVGVDFHPSFQTIAFLMEEMVNMVNRN